ncbi:unnamed protein product, partial [Pylaiella littoralis]
CCSAVAHSIVTYTAPHTLSQQWDKTTTRQGTTSREAAEASAHTSRRLCSATKSGTHERHPLSSKSEGERGREWGRRGLGEGGTSDGTEMKSFK